MTTATVPRSGYTGKRALDWKCVARVGSPHVSRTIRQIDVDEDEEPKGACGADATVVLEFWSSLSPVYRAFCPVHGATAWLAARSFLGITDARIENLFKSCHVCQEVEPGVDCGFEYQSHACPHHHWNMQPLDESGRCGDDSCVCMHEGERGSGPGGGGLDIGAYGSW
jgi:hypothetical protein